MNSEVLFLTFQNVIDLKDQMKFKVLSSVLAESTSSEK
jgi:hypothetical protein